MIQADQQKIFLVDLLNLGYSKGNLKKSDSLSAMDIDPIKDREFFSLFLPLLIFGVPD